MDILGVLKDLWEGYGGSIINFLTALGFLIAFYIVARIVRSLVAKGLGKTDLDNRFIHAVGLKEGFPIESVVSGVAFWLLMLFGFVTFFEKLDLEVVASPINELLKEVTLFLPKAGAAIGLLLVAWVIASLVKMGITKIAEAGRIDQRLNELDENSDQLSIGESLSMAGYWFVFLLFLPIILSVLEMQSLVEPLQDMFSKLFSFLPNILSCIIIFVVGNFIAKVVRKVITGLLSASGIDKITQKAGVKQNVSTLVGTLVFTTILLLVIVQALDALQIDAISEPAKQMISIIFTALPGIFAAALVIGISYYVGRLIADLVSDLLQSAGFDQLTETLGVGSTNITDKVSPSRAVGNVVLALVIMFSLLGATELIGFQPLSAIVGQIIQFTIQVCLGVVIISIGLFSANKVKDLILSTGATTMTAAVAKIAILVLASAMALQQIGLAEEIVNLAFGILLGALGIGAAIAIGLGSKDIAGREIESLIAKVKGQQNQ